MANVIVTVVVIVITLLLFLLLREFWCWYWKINKAISLLEEISQKLSPNNKVDTTVTK